MGRYYDLRTSDGQSFEPETRITVTVSIARPGKELEVVQLPNQSSVVVSGIEVTGPMLDDGREPIRHVSFVQVADRYHGAMTRAMLKGVEILNRAHLLHSLGIDPAPHLSDDTETGLADDGG